LRPVSFDWKNSVNYTAENGGKSDYGLIAQEVNNILPTLVAHDDDGTIIGLNYSGFVPFLIKGIQQQQGQINTLQGSVGNLNSQMSSTNGSVSQQQSQITNLQNDLGTLNGQLAAGDLTTLTVHAPLATVTGNDTTGTITITTGSNATADALVALTFAQIYGSAPHVVLTPANHDSAMLGMYYDADSTTSSGFTLFASSAPHTNTTYKFTYFIAQ
jgi:TolA-binding protein